MLDALAHAHRAGIVHRDVKPANILVEDRDELAIRLLDFGLAQFDGADTLTAVGDVPGTLAYISPGAARRRRRDARERRLVGRRPPVGDAHRPASVLGSADPGGRTLHPGRRASAGDRAAAASLAASSPPSTRRSRSIPRRDRTRPTSPPSCGTHCGRRRVGLPARNAPRSTRRRSPRHSVTRAAPCRSRSASSPPFSARRSSRSGRRSSSPRSWSRPRSRAGSIRAPAWHWFSRFPSSRSGTSPRALRSSTAPSRQAGWC